MTKPMGRPKIYDPAASAKRIEELAEILAGYNLEYRKKVSEIRLRHFEQMTAEVKAAREEYARIQAVERDEWNRLKRNEVATRHFYQKKKEQQQ